jgi:hypothetical protein
MRWSLALASLLVPTVMACATPPKAYIPVDSPLNTWEPPEPDAYASEPPEPAPPPAPPPPAPPPGPVKSGSAKKAK